MKNSKYFNGLASTEFEQLRESTQGLLKKNSTVACVLQIAFHRRMVHFNKNTEKHKLTFFALLPNWVYTLENLKPSYLDQTQQDLAVIA